MGKELADDIGARRRVGGRGERDDLDASECFVDRVEPQVFRAEVVSASNGMLGDGRGGPQFP